MHNRSVPCDTVLPHVVYEDVDAAIDWLTRTLGFREHFRYGEPTQGAQLLLGRACIMLRSARADCSSPGALGKWTQCVTIYLDDVDAHCAQARDAGAIIEREPWETEYGECVYHVKDPFGHAWEFSQHVRDVAPEEWGAKVR